MKNTLCENCLFSGKVSSGIVCEHNVISHLANNKKTLNIVNDFYVIENYMCKMGFSKNAFNNNTEKYTLENIKEQILTNACIKYYLVIDITSADAKQLRHICSKIKELKIPPKYLSFLIFKETSKSKIKILEDACIENTEWKVHNFIVSIEKMNGVHLALDTNMKKNGSQLLLFYNYEDIDDLDDDINEINTIINIEQPNFHILRKYNRNNLDGLLMSFDSYDFAKNQNKDIIKAISDLEGTIALQYGTK